MGFKLNIKIAFKGSNWPYMGLFWFCSIMALKSHFLNSHEDKLCKKSLTSYV